MSYKGKYKPSYPEKYKGNPTNIIYRSLWERKFMVFCDHNDSIIEWGSEEVIVPYMCPTDGKIHRYYPDFYIKVKESTGQIKKYLIEVKPKRQTIEPQVQKRKTKGYIYEVVEYAKNQAKWKAAEEYCRNKGWEFKLVTESDIFGHK